MEIKWNKKPKEVIRNINDDIDGFTKRLITATGKDIERATRRNFDRAGYEVPADNQFVGVSSTPAMNTEKQVWETTIVCGGNQVLFIEFGAGQKHETESPRTSGFQLNGETQVEIAPRPKGIVQLGNYGQHRGKGDAWWYKSQSGRESLHSHFYRLNRRGEFIMITSGIRPIRALWRATTNALNRVRKGKMKVK